MVDAKLTLVNYEVRSFTGDSRIIVACSPADREVGIYEFQSGENVHWINLHRKNEDGLAGCVKSIFEQKLDMNGDLLLTTIPAPIGYIESRALYIPFNASEIEEFKSLVRSHYLAAKEKVTS